jgi:small subunit ribosomal protein S7
MPPRLKLLTGWSLALRPKPRGAQYLIAPLQRRCASESAKDLPAAEKPKGPNQEQLPHVNEEAAAIRRVTGEASPDIEGHGTPMQEVHIKDQAQNNAIDACMQMLERDAEGKAEAPEVMKNNSNLTPKPNTNPAGSSQSRRYSTTTRRNTEPEVFSISQTGLPPSLEYPDGGLGHKFGLPDMPLPRTEHFRRRYDPVVEQLTKSLMRHGKLSAAQKVCLPYT